MRFRLKVTRIRKQRSSLDERTTLSVHTMNGHLPFIILGGQPASTLHADQGFGAREKAGRAYFGGNAPRIRFRYRTRSLSIGPLPCGFSVKNLPRHWSQTPIYIYLIPSINHPSNLPLFRPIFSCSNKPRPENHFPFHLHSNIYIYIPRKLDISFIKWKDRCASVDHSTTNPKYIQIPSEISSISQQT